MPLLTRDSSFNITSDNRAWGLSTVLFNGLKWLPSNTRRVIFVVVINASKRMRSRLQLLT